MVSTYFVHHGYCATAETFPRPTSQDFDEELTSIRNRQKIQKLVLSGHMGDPVHQLYTGLLENNLNLLFMIMVGALGSAATLPRMKPPQYSSTPLGLLLLLLLLLLADRGRGLRLSGVLVPRVVVSGSSVQLVCNYEQSSERHDPLYSLKWYRDVNQFYEYIPKREKQVRVYDIPYIHVDEEASSEGSVRLTGLTRAASGMFRCEVMSDKPYFETDDKAENMTVVDVPTWGPEVMGVVRGGDVGVVGSGGDGQSVERVGSTRVRPGDVLAARCEAGPSQPPANITWTLNHVHQPSPHAHLHHTQHTDQHGRHAQMSELQVEVQESWFGRGVMTLTCHVSLAHVYHRTVNLTLVHADHRKTADLNWLFSSGCSPGASLMLLLLPAALLCCCCSCSCSLNAAIL